MKVLHVIPSVSEKHGGPSYAIKAFAKVSRTAGIETIVATTDDDGDGAPLTASLGRPVTRDGITHFFFHRDLLPYKISFGLARWLDRHVIQFDVVQIHALFSFSSFAAARAARRHHVPYVIRPLGVLNRWGLENRRPILKRLSFRLIELPMLRRAAAIHYTTEAERKEANDVHPELGGFPSFVLPVPLEAESKKGNAAEFVRRFPQAAGKRLILFLSRLDPKKGLELLFESFALLKQAEPDSLLILAGDGDKQYVRSLRERTEQLGIDQNILWTGFLGPQEKADAFAAATLFVLPSYSENFGIAAAEALAAGVPTLLSDQVALAQDVAAMDAAIVVPTEKAALSSALVRMLGDGALRQRLSSSGRNAAAKLFSPEAVGAALARKYEEIRKAHSPPQ